MLPACKERVISSKNAVSPRAHTSVAAPTTVETSPTVANQEALRLLGPIDDPDASQRGQLPSSVPTGTPDAMSNAQKAALARAGTEKAVTAAISARVTQLQRCYESTATAAATVKVSIRVQRSGYVLDATVTGCNDQARSCMVNLLKQMRVSGVQTDTITVQRTFNFRERKVIRYTK